jgi:hypothetical protein
LIAGNIVALLHSFFSNLPQEWLESSHTVIKHLRPVNSVAMLRIAFRILGPLLPRLAFARPLFMKVCLVFPTCFLVTKKTCSLGFTIYIMNLELISNCCELKQYTPSVLK